MPTERKFIIGKVMEKDKGEATSSSSSSKNSIEEEEEEINEKACDYEQQRLSRIRENRARLEALGLPSLASSLHASSSSSTSKRHGSTKKNKKKKKKGDDDDEYRPSDDDAVNRGEDDDEDVGDFDSSRVKGKKTSSSNAIRVGKSSFVKRNRADFDQIDDDAALQQAIALSLGRTTEESVVAANVVSINVDQDKAHSSVHGKKDKANMQETAGRRKSRKTNKSRVQLTEDEVVAYFFSFDEAGKGHISLRDLQRMVLTHDFSWSEMEIASMIHSFDSDRDGKLSLEDFRTIVSRCNMMQETGNC